MEPNQICESLYSKGNHKQQQQEQNNLWNGRE